MKMPGIPKGCQVGSKPTKRSNIEQVKIKSRYGSAESSKQVAHVMSSGNGMELKAYHEIVKHVKLPARER